MYTTCATYVALYNVHCKFRVSFIQIYLLSCWHLLLNKKYPNIFGYKRWKDINKGNKNNLMTLFVNATTHANVRMRTCRNKRTSKCSHGLKIPSNIMIIFKPEVLPGLDF